MSATTAVLAGRRAAEALMLDSCVITRVTGSTTDPNTGVKTPVEETVYDGRCRVQQRNQVGQRVDAGEVSSVLLRFELHLPVATSVGLREGDVATITASGWDPDLVGREFRVHDLAHASQKTARRLGVEEVT